MVRPEKRYESRSLALMIVTKQQRGFPYTFHAHSLRDSQLVTWINFLSCRFDLPSMRHIFRSNLLNSERLWFGTIARGNWPCARQYWQLKLRLQ